MKERKRKFHEFLIKHYEPSVIDAETVFKALSKVDAFCRAHQLKKLLELTDVIGVQNLRRQILTASSKLVYGGRKGDHNRIVVIDKYLLFLDESTKTTQESTIHVVSDFIPLSDDIVKTKVMTESVVRDGQDEFRESLFKAYDGKCCITGESTKETLQAAHIQSYVNKDSHHVQNGLLLRADLHLLYDNGLLTVDHDYKVRISKRIESEYYQGFNGRQITLPLDPCWYPSKEALKIKMKEFIL